jgi:hypothetical protein
MKERAVPLVEPPPALSFEKIRKLWPRYPDLVAQVNALTGWRDTWEALVQRGDQPPAGLTPHPIEDEMAQPRALKECAAKMRRAEQKLDALSVSDLREAGISFRHIMWLLSTLAPANREIKRRLRLWSADCVARVLPLFEMAHRHDSLVRNAIQVTRRFARGELANMERQRAAVTAGSILTRRLSAGLVVSAASYLVRENDSWADNVAAKYSRSAVLNSRESSGHDETEMQWQFERLISRMSACEPDDWPLLQAPVEEMHASDGWSRRKIIENIPSRLDHFADREDDLSKLHELLANSNIPKERLIVVRGSAGKTELAIEYAHRFADSYSGIWWCSADSRELLIDSLVTLAQRTDCGNLVGLNHASIAKRVARSLAGRQSPFLLIFDHAVCLEDLYAFIPAVGARCIVTTDQKSVGRPEIVLQNVSNRAAAEFLQRVAGETDLPAAVKIAVLENSDLAVLWTIGKECRSSGLSLRKWLQLDGAYVPYFCRKRFT